MGPVTVHACLRADAADGLPDRSRTRHNLRSRHVWLDGSPYILRHLRGRAARSAKSGGPVPTTVNTYLTCRISVLRGIYDLSCTARWPRRTAARAQVDVMAVNPCGRCRRRYERPAGRRRPPGAAAFAADSRGIQRHTKAARSPDIVKAPSRSITACTCWRTSATTSAHGPPAWSWQKPAQLAT